MMFFFAGASPTQSLAEEVVSPPFVFLGLVKSSLRPDFHIAAQNCWVKKGGAFTGEVRYVLLLLDSTVNNIGKSGLKSIQLFM